MWPQRCIWWHITCSKEEHHLAVGWPMQKRNKRCGVRVQLGTTSSPDLFPIPAWIVEAVIPDEEKEIKAWVKLMVVVMNATLWWLGAWESWRSLQQGSTGLCYRSAPAKAGATAYPPAWAEGSVGGGSPRLCGRAHVPHGGAEGRKGRAMLTSFFFRRVVGSHFLWDIFLEPRSWILWGSSLPSVIKHAKFPGSSMIFPADGPFFWDFPAMLQELQPPCRRCDQVVCRELRWWCDGVGSGVGCWNWKRGNCGG